MGRFFRFALMLATLWLVGFFVFIATLPTEKVSQERLANLDSATTSNSGIAVYTGGGGKRITKAIEIFGTGISERLLISGVHPNISREEIQRLWAGQEQRFTCCVDIGIEAQTTKGNAAELIDWAKQHQFETIILVTSDFHLPRALAETQAIARNITIIPYSTPSPYVKIGGFPKEPSLWLVLAKEYSKFLMAHLSILHHKFTT